jgi:hypothetical protein
VSILEDYFRELRDIRSSGATTPETSYYTPLANLLNEVDKSLRPRVRCVLQLANRGAGQPDGGLFTQEQLRHADNTQPPLGQTPNRGVIEVKSTGDDAWVTADSRQVSRYWDQYRQRSSQGSRGVAGGSGCGPGAGRILRSLSFATCQRRQAGHPRGQAGLHVL